MESATWLRIAAGLTAFQAAGHTFGAVLAFVTAPIVVAAAITVCLGLAAASTKPMLE